MTDERETAVNWPESIKDVSGVWGYKTLLAWAEAGGVDVIDGHMMQPASIDLRLGDTIRVENRLWKRINEMIDELLTDGRQHASVDDRQSEALGYYRLLYGAETRWLEPEPFKNYLLMPGEAVLCHTRERVQIPEFASSFLTLKSSLGRDGIAIAHMGFGECGFGLGAPSQWTFTLYNIGPSPKVLQAGSRVVQMILIGMQEAEYTYATRPGDSYQGQTGSTVSRDEKIVYNIATGASQHGDGSSKSFSTNEIKSAADG